MQRLLQQIRRLARLGRGKPIPAYAQEYVRRDEVGLGEDPGLDACIDAALRWLCRAQDCSATADGGVARAFTLKSGWQSSYPETTGYIIPTFLECAAEHPELDLAARARRMLDWLVAIQLPCGGFQGGRVESRPIVPVVFNTGQILMGLAAGERAFGGYRRAMERAADWLLEVQDADGCWRKGSSPFAGPGDKTYDTHTAWGLLEAARIEPNRGYADAALANVRWAISRQRSNGWMENCCLDDFVRPLTHTLGYALRGMLEAHRFSKDRQYLDAARRLADGLKSALRDDGFLPGTLTAKWSAAADWACLTGIAQIAHCWFLLYLETGERSYLDAAQVGTRYVRRTLRLDDAPDTRGAVQGSFPIDGGYSPYEYPNWAAKFLIDALLLERDVQAADAAQPR